MDFTIVNRTSSQQKRTFFTAVLKEICQQLTRRRKSLAQPLERELSVIFVDEEEIRKLNHSFRNKNSVTDVLSFSPAITSLPHELPLGELILCPKKIRQDAKTHQSVYQAHMAYVVLHGILHLLGYDHEKNKREAVKMFKLQDAVFAQLLTCRRTSRLLHSGQEEKRYANLNRTRRRPRPHSRSVR